MHARFPAAEQSELAEVFRGYGAEPDTAAAMAAAVSADPDTALRVHAREELGVDPAELPSPVLAGASSLAAFSSGALIPLLPYLAGLHSLPAAMAITAAALLAGGMTVGRLTGRPVLRSGLRQLALGAIAVAVTFGVGSLIGTHAHWPATASSPAVQAFVSGEASPSRLFSLPGRAGVLGGQDWMVRVNCWEACWPS
jgi:VIT1/CCC1 family predicted Fe2+/Mn2+ transporter